MPVGFLCVFSVGRKYLKAFSGTTSADLATRVLALGFILFTAGAEEM